MEHLEQGLDEGLWVALKKNQCADNTGNAKSREIKWGCLLSAPENLQGHVRGVTFVYKPRGFQEWSELAATAVLLDLEPEG